MKNADRKSLECIDIDKQKEEKTSGEVAEASILSNAMKNANGKSLECKVIDEQKEEKTN